MVEDQIIAYAEDAPDILVGAGVEADAVRGDADARQLSDGPPRVEDEVSTVVHVENTGVVTVSSIWTSNAAVVLEYAAIVPIAVVALVMWTPGVVEVSVAVTLDSAAGPAFATGTVIRAVSPASRTLSWSQFLVSCIVTAPGASRPFTSLLSTIPVKVLELRAGDTAQLPKPRRA